MFCNKCGNELPDGASFCTSCGARQTIPSDSTPVSEPQVTHAVRPPEIYTQPEMNSPVEPTKRPKKKGVFLKVIVALVLVLVLGAGVTVLGYYTFLPAKTTLLIAEYASVLKSYDTFDKEMTQYEDKTLKPQFEKPIAKESEITFSLDRSLLEASGLPSETLDLVEESLKNMSIKYGYELDAKGEKGTVQFGLNYMKNPAITANIFMDGTKFGFGVPELFQKTITGDFTNLDNLANLSPDITQESLDVMGNINPWLSNRLYDEVKLDKKAVKDLMVKFSQELIKGIDNSDMTIKRGKSTEVLGKDTNCQEVTIKLDQKAQKKLVGNLITLMKDDKNFYNLTIGNILKVVDIMSENEAYAQMLQEIDLEELLSKSNYKEALLSLKGSLDESYFPEELTVKAYISGLDVVKYVISLPVNESGDEVALTIEKQNDGLSHKTNVSLTGDSDGESVAMNLSISKKYDESSDTSDYVAEFTMDANTESFQGKVNFTLDSNEKPESKNEITHDMKIALNFSGNTYGVEEQGDLTLDINGTKVRNSNHLVTSSDYTGQLSMNIPNELPQPISMGFGITTETAYGEKVEIPEPEDTLDLSTATQSDLDELTNEIYEKIGALQMMLGGM